MTTTPLDHPLVAHARKEAKRLLRLTRSGGWTAPTQLAEALDLIAHLKGYPHWQGLAHAPRAQPDGPEPPDWARTWVTPLRWREQPHAQAPWMAQTEKLAMGRQALLLARPGEGASGYAAHQLLVSWAHDPSVERCILVGLFAPTPACAAALSALRPDHPVVYWDGSERHAGFNVLVPSEGVTADSAEHRTALLGFFRRLHHHFGPQEPFPRAQTELLLRQLYAQCVQTPLAYRREVLPEVDAALRRLHLQALPSWAAVSDALARVQEPRLAWMARQHTFPTWHDLLALASAKHDDDGASLRPWLAHAVQALPWLGQSSSGVTPACRGAVFNGHHVLGWPGSRTKADVWVHWTQLVGGQIPGQRTAWVFDELQRIERDAPPVPLPEGPQHAVMALQMDDDVPLLRTKPWDAVLLFNPTERWPFHHQALTPAQHALAVQALSEMPPSSGGGRATFGALAVVHPATQTVLARRLEPFEGATCWLSPLASMAALELRSVALEHWSWPQALTWLHHHYPQGLTPDSADRPAQLQHALVQLMAEVDSGSPHPSEPRPRPMR